MAVNMSDDNNNVFNNGFTPLSTDSGSGDSDSFNLSDILAAVSHNSENSLSVGEGFAGNRFERARSQSSLLANDDTPQFNGWNSDDTWELENHFEMNNRYNASPEWNQPIGPRSSPVRNARLGLRPIRGNSVSEVVYTTAPIDDSPPPGGTPPLDWYSHFVEQTQRFAEMNGKPEKQLNQRHVHFEEQDNWMNRSNDSLRGSEYSPFEPLRDIHFPNDIRVNNGSAIQENRSMGGMGSRGSFIDAFCKEILKPVAENFQHNSQYMAQKFNQNLTQIQTTLNKSTIFGDSVWANPAKPNNSIYRMFGGAAEEGKSHLQKLLSSVRKPIQKSLSPNYTWSGQLPRRIRTKTPVYSCKVFLGGIPYDLTDSDLHCTFAQFGHIQIQWPGKDIRSAIEGAAANKAGYVYIIFETYDNVAALLSSCTMSYRDIDSGCRWYYNISSRRQKSKEVQVIPFDIGDRFFMKSSFSGQMEHSRTVFVGALHGMLAADGLAKVMDDLFGGVIFAGLDTDKHKYPLGSGRVTFDNQESYSKAVSAAFVEIKSARFKKKIQIDPYIESESMCVVCRASIQNPIFCREEGLYFCGRCWESQHSDPDSANHRPIVKNKSSKI